MQNPLLLVDFYKVCHSSQYPKGLTRMVSYYTPRMSRLGDVDKVTLFGLQAFINEYLIEGFNNNFFNRNINEVLEEYNRTLTYTMGAGSYDDEKILKLHQRGYLPLQIRALPEGTRSNIGVPQIEISNTHPDFVWLVNTIETMLSCTMWHTQVSAEVGYRYRQIVDKYVAMTCSEGIHPANVLGDFSMRGQQSVESAIKSSAGWLLSFNNTATVPAIMWMEKNYECDITKETVGRGAISTEHSVMCSNFTVDCNEITQVKRLLTEIYPDHSFSMVSDSYDYWNMVNNIIPQCKEEILTHNGYIGIRGDSGDPIEVVTETVFRLWDIFGGRINSKGYKELDPHVKAIYGDSITPYRCEEIYKRLEAKGFAVNNVVLGVGSFSMMCLEKHNEETNEFTYSPYTRDTFGIAVKATYAEDKNGDPIMIFKQPKDCGWKKSQKGCCIVRHDENGNYTCEDNHTWDEAYGIGDLETVFHDGHFHHNKKQTLAEIRERMYGGK